jgi:hypothetical protein
VQVVHAREAELGELDRDLAAAATARCERRLREQIARLEIAAGELAGAVVEAGPAHVAAAILARTTPTWHAQPPTPGT